MASRSTARSERAHAARLAAAAGRPPRLGFDGSMRLAARISALVVVLLPSLIGHGLWRLLGRKSPWPRLFLGAAARVAGARVRRVGLPMRRDVVFIPNHVSWIDILAIAGASGSAFVAKEAIGTAPVVGWLAGLNNTVYVSREDRGAVAEQIARLRAAFIQASSVTIFAEGTTDDGRSLLPFKSSLLKVLEPAPQGVVVQPLFLDYGNVGPDIAWLGVEGGAMNAVRVLARRGTFVLTIHFLAPFDPAEIAGRKAIAAEARRRIAAALSAKLGGPAPDFIGHDAWASGVVVFP